MHECAVRLKDWMLGCSERESDCLNLVGGCERAARGCGDEEESPRKVKTCVTGITLQPAALTRVPVTFTAT